MGYGIASVPMESQSSVRVSLTGGPKRSLCEAVKLKPGLPWRTQGVRDARYLWDARQGELLMEWNQAKRMECVAVNNE